MLTMSEEQFRASTSKRSMDYQHDSEYAMWTPPKRKKRSLLQFCNIVLQHEKYEQMKQEEMRQNSTSPHDSNGSSASDSIDLYVHRSADSSFSESTISCYSDGTGTYDDPFNDLDQAGVVLTGIDTSRQPPSPSEAEEAEVHPRLASTETVYTNEDDGKITCFCMKPYGGRQMIQCDGCALWIHCSCAKIRKNKIPNIFICQACKQNSYIATKRKSERMSPLDTDIKVETL